MISSAVMYPLNNVATRLQVQNSAKEAGAYHGTWDTFQRLVREEGILSLYAYVGAMAAAGRGGGSGRRTGHGAHEAGRTGQPPQGLELLLNMVPNCF